MTHSTQQKRTWAGYACPVCRFVFRVPKGHAGKGVICPACRHLLNLPRGGELSQPADPISPEMAAPVAAEPRNKKENLPIAARSFADVDAAPAVKPEKRRHSSSAHRKVRRKKATSEREPSWDQARSSSSSAGASSLLWVVGGSVLGLGVVAIGAWLVMANLSVRKEKSGGGITQVDQGNMETPDNEINVTMTPDELKAQREIEESVNTGMDVMEAAEKVVRDFLTAESSAELEKLVRTPGVTVPRMRAWYAQHAWQSPGVKDVGYGGGVTVKGVMASMSVRLGDYSIRHIAVERTPDGYLVDWESWVAWTEVRWPDVFKQKPVSPIELRVTCYPDSYYNRMFRDDQKWLVVRMEYPDADRALYGYIDRQTSTLTSLLGDLKSGRALPATLKVKFPEGSVADNQVEIVDYIQNGWVRPPKELTIPSEETNPHE
ncbi:hypothetical protein HW115_12220 [Verrucomicrobiaceae bacterium N1E253]|uniref:Uncharacterized protein n=1 Tax=Oceaniferula marina TaxID=2748318 RepID=A0A851GNH7_9BACT|nr:hypothetical protein [Oceaniferula marina]NWK56380.1 hypothetical protein [Oceaniferula marina]